MGMRNRGIMGQMHMHMQVSDEDHYQEHAHNMGIKRLRTEEEIDQRDFLLTAQQEDK